MAYVRNDRTGQVLNLHGPVLANYLRRQHWHTLAPHLCAAEEWHIAQSSNVARNADNGDGDTAADEVAPKAQPDSNDEPKRTRRKATEKENS